MQKNLNILSQAWSILLYPMLMPLYGILLFCFSVKHFLPLLSTTYIWLCIAGTVVLTLFIPVMLLFLMWRKGYIDSLYINNTKQRTTPYIYTLICYGFWGYFLRVTMQLPIFLLFVVVGAMVALLLVTIINNWWKISAHLTGIGGLLGGICSFALNYSTLPLVLIIIVFVVALLLMYARIYLNAHTPMQVVCGFLLGLFCTFIPTFIMTYA
jgi:membrane-associated phospholipid phosphatase